MVNQHVLESELGYLGGIIDGEGTITLDRSGNRRMSGVMGLQAKLIVANTNEAIVQHVINIINNLGVKPHIKSSIKARNKRCYWISVSGLTKTAKILNAVKPYLVGKFAQAQLVLDFIAHRGNNELAKGKPYGSIELGILEKIRALNFRGTSETEDRALRSFINKSTNEITVQAIA